MSNIVVTSKNGINTTLYPHQTDSVKQIEEFYHTGKTTRVKIQGETESKHIVESNVVILGDAPGYGKTLTICTFLSRNLQKVGEERQCYMPYTIVDGIDNVRISSTQKLETIPQAVIICDKKLIHQWENELDTVGVSYITYDTPKSVKDGDEIYDDLFDENDNLNTQVVIVSAHIFSQFLSSTEEFAYSMFIIDEYTDIKLEKCGDYDKKNVNFTLLISGTSYGRIHFRPTRYFLCRSIINYGMIDHNLNRSLITIEHSKEVLDQSIILPEPVYVEYKYIPNVAVVRYANYISDEARSALINGDIDHAFGLLGVQTGQSLKEVLIEKLKNKIDNNAEAIALTESEETKNRLLEKAETLKKQLEDLENNVEDEDDMCPICFDDFSDGSVTITKCEHKFHSTCIAEMLAHDRLNTIKCPSCRTINAMSDLTNCGGNTTEADQHDQQEEDSQPKNQKETTKNIIKKLMEDPNKKILVYCQYDTKRTFTYALQEYSDQLCFVGGTRKQMDKQIKNFKEGNTRILFMKSTKDASGLNLPETTDIVIMHTVPHDVKEQIIARSVRIGVTHQTTIHQMSALDV